MTVNTQRPNFLRPPTVALSGQRLYLREDELDAGVALILEAGHRLKATTIASREKYGLNWTEARALINLLRAPQGVLALSTHLDITKQAAIKTAETLQSRGLVTRASDPRDGRRRTIGLTVTGDEMARDISASMRILLANAYRHAGNDAVAGSDTVLNAIKSGSPSI